MSNIHYPKKISFKISINLKAKLIIEQHKERVQFYNEFVRGIIMNYIHQGKCYNIDVKRSEIIIDKASPTCLNISDKQNELIEEILEDLNRKRNELIHMILADYIKKKREQEELNNG